MKTQGKIEAAICEGIGRFEQEYMGRGPTDVHSHLIGDLLVVRLQGVLTAAERHLVQSLPAEKGRNLIKQVRVQLIETARPVLEALVQEITGQDVEPAPRRQHRNRRGGYTLHPGRATWFPGNNEEVAGSTQPRVMTWESPLRATDLGRWLVFYCAKALALGFRPLEFQSVARQIIITSTARKGVVCRPPVRRVDCGAMFCRRLRCEDRQREPG